MSRLTELEHENRMLWKTLKEEREKIIELKGELAIYKPIVEKLSKIINFNELGKTMTAFSTLTKHKKEINNE